MNEINDGDLSMMYKGCVCLYKGKPYKVMDVGPGGTFVLLNLKFGKKSTVKFNADDFGPPRGRIGFVNHGAMAFYVTRNPMRQWSIGLKRGNVVVNAVESIFHKRNFNDVRNEVREMNIKAIGEALKGVYPSFDKAVELAVKAKGVFAFDRQFAVDAGLNIFYKTKKVGKLERIGPIQEIQFDKGREYLEIPLLQHYEKTFRTFRGDV